jgi:hypothetical protein
VKPIILLVTANIATYFAFSYLNEYIADKAWYAHAVAGSEVLICGILIVFLIAKLISYFSCDHF